MNISEDRAGEIYELVKDSYLFKEVDSEAVVITSAGNISNEEEWYFLGEGSISGMVYTIWYTDIDLKSDKFYKLVEVVHGY